VADTPSSVKFPSSCFPVHCLYAIVLHPNFVIEPETIGVKLKLGLLWGISLFQFSAGVPEVATSSARIPMCVSVLRGINKVGWARHVRLSSMS
jgi:hypothetical protein